VGSKDGQLLLGFFGFLSKSKGVETLLRAVRLLLNEGREVRLVLIGAASGLISQSDQSDAAECLALIRQFQLDSSLETTGYLIPSEVSAHLLACDVLALPYDDGASFRRGSLLAAFEHGRPVVTTSPALGADGDGVRRLVAGEHFMAVPPREPRALADAISDLSNDAALRRRLGAAGKELAERCSWPAIARETMSLYREVLSGLWS